MDAVMNSTLWDVIQSIKSNKTSLSDWKNVLDTDSYNELSSSFDLNDSQSILWQP